MGFSSKRGRPKLEREKQDMGTMELRRKISNNQTAEPLDLCLKKKIISESEHQAGMRLKWLYTLRFGAPGISAYNFNETGAGGFRNDSDDWLRARHNEYENMLAALEKINAKRITVNVCIFNQRSAFLLPYSSDLSAYELKIRRAQFMKFKSGVEALADIGATRH